MVPFELLIEPFIHCCERIWVLTGQYELPFSRGDVTSHPPGSVQSIRFSWRDNFRSALHPKLETGAPGRPYRGTSLSNDIWLLRQHELPHVLAAILFRVMISFSVRDRTRTGKLRCIISSTSSLFKT
jgi:hypothetical protein